MRMRKLLCLGLAAAIACTSLPAMGVQAQEVQTRQQEEREVTSGNGESEDEFQIENGVLVAYNGAGGDVVIPEGVTSIGEFAFGSCNSLKSVIIPDGVTSIGDTAFIWCGDLTSVTLPESVIRIGESAFYGCEGLVSMELPESVVSIGGRAFAYCSSLENIILSEGIAGIDEFVFLDCSSLKNLVIPASVTSLGQGICSGCNGLEGIEVDGANQIYDSRDDCNAIIQTKGNILIAGCKNTSIPNGVEDIESFAFENCSSLLEITIPESVKLVSSWAFLGCSGLKKIIVDDGNQVYDSRNNCNAIIETENNSLVVGCDGTVIPEGIETIGSSAFYGRSGLMEIELPESITQIEDYAFMDCSSLVSVTIPKSVVNIEDRVFYNCSGLKHIVVSDGNPIYDSRNNCNAIIQTESNTLMLGCKNTYIPASVNAIGNSAFYNCDGLTNITIPASATTIGDDAFSGCVNLTSVTVPQSVTAIGDGAFFNVHDDFTLLVIAGSYAETYAKENDIPYSIVEEGDHTHSYQSQITTQPGCTTAGVRTFTCSCGDSYTETIAAAGHKYTKTTQNPTCTVKGAVTHTCSVCNHSYKEETAAAGHKYTKTTKNPTCTAKGTITYTCSVCKHSYQQEIAAAGHKYKKTTTKATCTAKGAIICTCTVCKHKYTEKTFPAAGHKYVTTTVAANMNKNGTITTTCKVCKKKSQTIIYAPKTVALSKTEAVYNGKQQKPKVTVKDSKGKNLKKGRDYTVAYQKDMKKVGQHTVTVRFKGNYRGTAKMYLAINPRGTSLSKATPTEKGFDVKWKKQKKEISGYEIAYSTSNKFTPRSTKILTVGKGKTSKSITGLKAKKKYYVRIRTYKKVKGKKYYSEWSKAKSVKTKK